MKVIVLKLFIWFSIFDPRVSVIGYDKWNVKVLKLGMEEVSFTIEHNLNDAT